MVPVNGGMSQRCAMFICLFGVYVDGVVREVNARMLEKGLNC